LGPGTCPKCGMALEPKVVQAGDDDHARAELRDMERRLWVAIALTAPSSALAMAEMFGLRELVHAIGETRAALVQLALVLPVVAWSGAPLLARAVASLRQRSPNMFTLIGLGVAAAFLYSVVVVVDALVAPTT